MPRARWRSGVVRGAAALLPGLLVALALAGAGRLAVPPVARAVDCNMLSGPIANNDPATAGDPLWRTLEDNALTIYDPSVFANDTCIQTTITSWELRNQTGGSYQTQGGDIFFTPATNYFGAATFEYRFTSWAASNWATATITVVPVNDSPVLGPQCSDITIAEDNGPYTSSCVLQGYPSYGTNPLESGQALTGHVTNDDSLLFAVQPAWQISTASPAQPFTFTPRANAHGFTWLYFWVTDDGGTANGGENESPLLTVGLTITPVDDPTVVGNDVYSTPVGTTLSVSAANGVLSNDSDPDGPLTASLDLHPNGGDVTLKPNGSFVFVPDPGFIGAAKFSYFVSDGNGGTNGHVTVNVLAPGATPPPTPPPATPIPTAVPGSSGAAVPTATAGPRESGGASGVPATASPPPATGLLPSPAASDPAGPAAPAGGSDSTPWLVVLLIVVIAVIGLNAGLYQYLRSRRSQAPPEA